MQTSKRSDLAKHFAQNQRLRKERKKESVPVCSQTTFLQEHEMFHCNEFLVVGWATEEHCTSTVAKDLLSATCKTHIEATCGQKLNFSFHAMVA